MLLVITFLTNYAAQRVVKRFEFSGRAATDGARAISLKATGRGAPAPARRTGSPRARRCSPPVLAIAVLAVVIWSVGSRGVGAINLDFFTEGPAGSSADRRRHRAGARRVAAPRRVATVIALPIGVLTAIFVSEFAPPPSASRSGSGSTC